MAAKSKKVKVVKPTNPERLTSGEFVPPSTIKLEFADGFSCQMNIDLLEMPIERINWPTLKLSPSGDKVIFRGIKGDLVPINSTTSLIIKFYESPFYSRIKGARVPGQPKL